MIFYSLGKNILYREELQFDTYRLSYSSLVIHISATEAALYRIYIKSVVPTFYFYETLLKILNIINNKFLNILNLNFFFNTCNIYLN